MDYSISIEPLDQLETDCLVAGVFKGGKLTPGAAAVDKSAKGLLKQLIARDEFEGKPGDVLAISHTGITGLGRIALLGLGERGTLSRKDYRKALSAVFKHLKDINVKTSAFALEDWAVEGADKIWLARQIGEICGTVFYRYTQTKKDDDGKARPVKLQHVILQDRADAESALQEGSQQGLALARAMNMVRDMANLPGNICTPIYLAEQAEKVGKSHKKLKVKVLDEHELAELGMGSFLSVAKGSRQPPRLIVMEYKSGGKAKPIVLVGKGLTFDAGGISIKPAANMDEMKYDMCGGASVIGIMAAVADLKLPLNVVGIVPASENLPDGNANKPGDIVTSMAGITIEILNTDAEGRLLLCDALHYAKRYDPAAVIDMATLTGACIVALGRHPSGLMGNDDGLCEALSDAGDESCDRVWRLPIWDDYQEQLKSNFADVANIGGPDGGTITAACFLSRFAKDFKWAHLDIAGTAWKSGADKGATGRPLPLLLQYLLNHARAA